MGNDERIEKLAKELDLSLEGIEIVNLRHDREAERRERYAKILAEKKAREGYTFEEANDKMFERNYFGMMMVETGEADAFITGVYTKYSNTIKVAKEVIGIQPEYNHFGTMHIMNSKKGTYFLADTLIKSPSRHGNDDRRCTTIRKDRAFLQSRTGHRHVVLFQFRNGHMRKPGQHP